MAPPNRPYTTKLGAGLGLIEETNALLTLWSPGMSTGDLYRVALESGRFPTVTARRLRNVVMECFAPRYLVNGGAPARHLKGLVSVLESIEIQQLMFIYTCRANPVLGDFVRRVYWERYAGGYTILTNDDARTFIRRAIDDEKTSMRWADTMVSRVSAYLVGCCADYGLLERGRRSDRKILSFRIAPNVATYLAYDLHLREGVGDNALLDHEDWQLFGLSREDVLDELKRVGLRGLLIVQAAGNAIRIGWKYADMEALCDVLAHS
ncbi:MAG TPA: BrxA family protein [Candidatus Deferrimicrobium sp.]|nr:BrxA family protein [Candidatus Deferrimicrobium sp.]